MTPEYIVGVDVARDGDYSAVVLVEKRDGYFYVLDIDQRKPSRVIELQRQPDGSWAPPRITEG